MTGCCRVVIWSTGGGVLNSVVLEAKSETRSVADMMMRRSGCGMIAIV